MDDIERLRRLAGVDDFKGMKPYDFQSFHETSSEKRLLEAERGIQPGTEEWFDLWFNDPGRLNQVTGFRSRRK